MPEVPEASLGRRLLYMRKRLGFTIEELSKMSGLSHNVVARIERDETRVQPWVLGRILPSLATRFKETFPESNGDAYDFLIPPTSFGAWLRNQRLRRGIKLKELAKQLGVCSFTLIRYESDQSKPAAPVRDKLKRILKVAVLPVILRSAGI